MSVDTIDRHKARTPQTQGEERGSIPGARPDLLQPAPLGEKRAHQDFPFPARVELRETVGMQSQSNKSWMEAAINPHDVDADLPGVVQAGRLTTHYSIPALACQSGLPSNSDSVSQNSHPNALFLSEVAGSSARKPTVSRIGRWMVSTTLLAGLTCLTPALASADELSACHLPDGNLTPDQADVIAQALTKGDVRAADKQLDALLKVAPEDPRVNYFKSRVARKSNLPKDAERYARRALEKAPQCAPLVAQLADILVSTDRIDEAIPLLTTGSEANPNDVELHQRLAHVLVTRSQLEKALPHLIFVRDARPGDAEAHAAVAEVQGWLGKSADAIASFETADKLAPGALSSDRHKTWAEALRQSQRLEQALAQCDVALKISPRNPAVLLVKGQVLMDMRQYPAAVQNFQTVTRQQPKNAYAWASLARGYTAMDRRADARTPYGRALELSPNDDNLRVEVAQVLSALPEHREWAIDQLKPLTTKANARPEHILALAEILSWQAQSRTQALNLMEPLLDKPATSEAFSQKLKSIYRQTVLWMSPGPSVVPAAERALALFPGDLPLTIQLASCQSKDPARRDEAIRSFERVLALQPDNGEVRIARAELMALRKPADKAPIKDELVRGAAQAPQSAELQVRAGQTLLSIGYAEEALACFERALAKEPTLDAALEGRIEAYSVLGRYSDAVAAVDSALRAAGTPARRAELEVMRRRLDLIALRAKARAYSQAGKYKEAEDAWTQFLKSESDDPDAWTELGGAQSSQKNFRGALESFNRALSLKRDQASALEGKMGALMALDRPEDALDTLGRLRAVAPSAALDTTEKQLRYKLRLKQAQVLMRQGQKTEALALLQQLFKEDEGDFVLALMLGDLLIEEKQYAAATEVYQRAMRLQPENPAAQQGLAKAQWESNHRLEALALLRTVYARTPANARKGLADQLIGWEVTIAEEAKAQKKYSVAFDHYREAYALDPNRDYVLNGLGGLYWTVGQLELASKFYGMAAVKYPKNVESLKGAARTLLDRNLPHLVVRLLERNPAAETPELQDLLISARLTKDLDAIEAAWQRGETDYAEQLTLEVSARNPTRTEPWMRLGRLASQSGMRTQAVRFYRKANEIDPASQPVLLALISALQDMGRYPESADLIRQLRAADAQNDRVTPELDPLEAKSWSARGNFLAKQGQREQALAAWKKALELGLDAAWFYADIARLYADNQQTELALKFYELALARDKDNRDAARARAGVLLRMRRTAEAESTILWLNQQGDANQTDRILMAELAKQRGDHSDALERYRSLHDEAPEDIAISRGLIGALLEAGRPWEALDLLNALLPERPVDPELLRSTVAALRGMYASDLAVPVLRKLKKYWPSPELEKELQDTMLAALIEAAEAAKEREDLRRARQLYNEAFQQAPRKVEVLRGIAGLEARGGDFQSALKHFRDALNVDPDDGISIAGHAAAQASLGRYYVALDELKEGWNRTHSPRVGVELVKLLQSRERYMEADVALTRLEENLELSDISSEEELDDLRMAPQKTSQILESLQRFEQIWARIARRVPKVRQVQSPAPLQELKWQVASGVKRSSEQVKTAPNPKKPNQDGLPLPDIAPEIPIPSGFDDLEVMASSQVPADKGRVDLWLVDKMLNELDTRRVGSEDGSEPSNADAAPVVRAVLNPWSMSDDVTEVEEGRAIGSGEDMDDYSAYRPLVSRGRAYNRFIPPIWDPVSETITLRLGLDSRSGTRLYLGGWLNGRTGTAGTTEAFSAFGDVRLGIQLPGLAGLTLEPYAQPGMLTDGEDFQVGTMVGGSVYAHPGRFDVFGRVGSTPIGFRAGSSVMGLFKIGVDAADLLHIDVEASVDPVTDSLLSWAGKRSDEGVLYGHVTRTRGAASLTILLDARTSLVLGGDISRYNGLRMAENRSRQGQMIFQHVLQADEPSRFLMRVKLDAFGYERQQDSFEVGGGGYFSPLLFLVATGGGAYSGRGEDGRVTYSLGVDVGAQYVEGKESDSLTPGLKPVIKAEATGEMTLSPGLFLGARYEFDNVGADYTRNSFWLYLTRHFGRSGNNDK